MHIYLDSQTLVLLVPPITDFLRMLPLCYRVGLYRGSTMAAQYFFHSIVEVAVVL